MSILKLIMKPFVEFKEEQNTGLNKNLTSTSEPVDIPVAAPDQPIQANKPVDVVTSSYTNSAAQTGSIAATPQYQQHFDDLIEEANAKNPLFQGTDFKEFIDSKIDVETIADEATRYQTAFNVLKRTGLTKDRLVTTGKEYINLINQDLKGFEGAYMQQYKTDVAMKEQLLQQKAAEVKALNEKIVSMNQEIKKISEELLQNKERLNTNKDAFMQAGQNKLNELEDELVKIGRYF